MSADHKLALILAAFTFWAVVEAVAPLLPVPEPEVRSVTLQTQ